jgi:hypothetical protein
MNILALKIATLHRVSKNQNSDVLETGCNDFDGILIIYGDHALK